MALLATSSISVSTTLLHPLQVDPAGALLALGSGSRPSRETGVLVALDVQGQPNGRMATVDLGTLYAPLHERFADPNIEGALVVSGELLLLQRVLAWPVRWVS